MLKFWETLRAARPFPVGSQLLSTGQGNAETDEASNLVKTLSPLMRAEKRQDGFPHVGCVGPRDRCQSNRYAEPRE